MPTTAFDDRLGSFQRVSQLRAVVQDLHELLTRAHRQAGAAQELAELERLDEYAEAGSSQLLDDALSQEVRRKVQVVAAELAAIDTLPLETAVSAAEDLVAALEAAETQLRLRLQEGGEHA